MEQYDGGKYNRWSRTKQINARAIINYLAHSNPEIIAKYELQNKQAEAQDLPTDDMGNYHDPDLRTEHLGGE